MFGYYLRLGFASMRKNYIMSSLMIIAIALGIGASVSVVTVNYLMSSNPIPHKSEELFYVQLDSWSPHSPHSEPNEPPDQVTWRDATNLMIAQPAYKQTAIAGSSAVIEPEDKDVRPFMSSIRLAYADFFDMFEPPFLYGSGWAAEDDDGRNLVVVLNKEINDRVFGGENSVGRSITIRDVQFQVVGVLDDWQPIPRYYDVTVGAFNDVEDLFMPFTLKQELELGGSGNTNCWKSPEGEGFQAFLNSECVNYQFWVQLRNEGEKQAYMDFLNGYVDEQKALGRFERPHNNRLSDVMEWMENQEVVADDAQIMLWLAFMFLFVCLVNTVGLLLSKFSGKAPEIALRRAIGASRGDIFYQHIVETACIGLMGGVTGLLLALLGLEGIKSLYGDFMQNLVKLDISMVVFAFLLALVSSILAGLYPTWRACSVAPAAQLKQ
jgi:putative ABC transport system permease protein